MTENATAHTCMTCRFAEWKKTTNGRLHPSKDGRCTWPQPDFAIPVAFQFPYHRDSLLLSGGYITREERFMKECPTWQAK